MRKLIICILLIFTIQSVSADTVAEVTQKVMSRFNMLVREDDVNNLRFYKNHGLIDEEYKPLLSSAIRMGILVPVDGILSPESEDLTSVKNGLVNYSLRNQSLKIVAGRSIGQRIGGAEVNKETLFIDGDVLDENKIYTALVDIKNIALVAWEPTGMILPTLYRGTMYVKADNMMVMQNVHRSAFDMWIEYNNDKFVEVDLTGTAMGATDDNIVNEKYMDKIIYYIAEGFSAN